MLKLVRKPEAKLIEFDLAFLGVSIVEGSSNAILSITRQHTTRLITKLGPIVEADARTRLKQIPRLLLLMWQYHLLVRVVHA